MSEKREWDAEEAELEAQKAADELMDMQAKPEIDFATVSAIADWWRRHYLVCGHKRLARILMQVK